MPELVTECAELNLWSDLDYNANLASGWGYRDTRLKSMTRVMIRDNVLNIQARKCSTLLAILADLSRYARW